MIYKSSETIYGKPACFIRNDDSKRNNIILNSKEVSSLFIVWESEFKKNKDMVTDYIVEALLLERERNGINGK